MLEYGNNSYFETDSESIYITYIRRETVSGIKESLSLLTCVHHTDGPEGFKAIPLSDPHFCQSIVAPFFLHFFYILQ